MDISQYASAFPGLSDEDFIAAGFTPEDVAPRQPFGETRVLEVSRPRDLVEAQRTARRTRGNRRGARSAARKGQAALDSSAFQLGTRSTRGVALVEVTPRYGEEPAGLEIRCSHGAGGRPLGDGGDSVYNGFHTRKSDKCLPPR